MAQHRIAASAGVVTEKSAVAGRLLTMARRPAALSILAVCMVTGAAADPWGANDHIRAERQRVERIRDDMNAILDSTPGGRSVAEQLRAQRKEHTDNMLENALPTDLAGAVPAKPALQADRDPFVVTPQLRARGGSGGGLGYIKALPGMTTGEAPPMLLKGMGGRPGQRMALIEVKDWGLVRVREGETFQTAGGQAFRVKTIRGDAVVLETGMAETEFLVVR